MSWFWYKGRSHENRSAKDWNAPLPQLSARDERRLEALYAWEQRLRGYDLFPTPVALEPTFVPYDPLADAASGGWAGVPQPRDGALEGEDEHDPNGGAGAPLGFLTLRLPQEQKVAPAEAQAFLAALRALSRPVALEIIADARSIRYQAACTTRDATSIGSAFSQCFPPRQEARTRFNAASAVSQIMLDGPDALMAGLAPLADRPCVQRVVDFGLYHPAYRPLRLFESFASDPHAALLGALGTLEPGEVAGVQVLAVPAHGSWAPSLSLLVAQFDGATGAAHPNTSDDELQRGLRYKLATPLWSAALRAFAFASDEPGAGGESVGLELAGRALDLCRRIGTALDGFESDTGQQEAGNRFVALDDAGYPDRERLRDLLGRRSRRTGMLLSQAELAGLWHPPSERLAHPRLLRYDPHRHELPDYLKSAPGAALGVLAPYGGLDGGANGSSGAAPQLVTWPDAMRNRHLYMLGATRMGKSTLLLNLIAQDMLAGRGLCLIDPHGDLALDVLRRVPPQREDDVLYLDLSDTAHPPALGLLEAGDEWEQRLLVSDLLAILHRLFAASWGDRLEHILRHALLTLLAAEASPLGTPLTLRDIRPLLASKEYRRKLLERVPDPDLQTFWHSEFPGYTASAFAPVYNKLGLLLSSPTVRNIVGGSQSKLHAGRLMRDRGILLVNLAQSLIGEDNAHFLGALLVSKIQLAAMHGLRYDPGEREPFTLYVDEFQNFVVSSFEKILSEAGKAGLTLVMANQFLEQLGEHLPTAIRSNTGTLISFRVSAQSGRALEGEFGGRFGAQELTDLERGQAVARLGRAGDSFLVHTFPPVERATMGTRAGAAQIIREETYARVCRERQEVEAELRAGDEALRALLEEAAQAEHLAKARPSSKAQSSAKTRQSPTPASQGRQNGNGEDEAGDEEVWQAEDDSRAVDEPTVRSRPAPSPRSLPASRSRQARSAQTRLGRARRTSSNHAAASMTDDGTIGQGDTAPMGGAAPKGHAASKDDAAPGQEPIASAREGNGPEGYEQVVRPILADGPPPADFGPTQHDRATAHDGAAENGAPVGGDSEAEGVDAQGVDAQALGTEARSIPDTPANASVASENSAGRGQQEHLGDGSWGSEPSAEPSAQDVTAAPSSPSVVLPATTTPTLFFGFPEPLVAEQETPDIPPLKSKSEATTWEAATEAITKTGEEAEKPQHEGDAGDGPAGGRLE